MSEMIERVARALAAKSESSFPPDAIVRNFDNEAVPFWHLHVDLARAVIEAMREPTRQMLAAGGFYHIQGANAVSESDMKAAKRTWQAMIAAALSPSREDENGHN